MIKAVFRFLSILLILILSIWSQSISLMLTTFILALLFWHPTLWDSLTPLLQGTIKNKRRMIEWSLAGIFSFVVISFCFTNFIAVYQLHSSSMMPELKSGQTILINKSDYGPAIHRNNLDNYRRIEGFGQIDRGAILAFYFPEADTSFKDHPNENYYFLKRQQRLSGTAHLPNGKIQYLKVDERPVFVKRLIALPGDTLVIKDGTYMVNSQVLKSNHKLVHRYRIIRETNYRTQQQILSKALQSYREDATQYIEIQEGTIKTNQWEKYVEKVEEPMNMPNLNVFPFTPGYYWNTSYLGPLVMPQKGKKINLTFENLPLYRRIIENYEGHRLRVDEDKIMVDGKAISSYTFKMNYYWVGGDNRHHSFDSRYWGFVPENHIIGRVTHSFF